MKLLVIVDLSLKKQGINYTYLKNYITVSIKLESEILFIGGLIGVKNGVNVNHLNVHLTTKLLFDWFVFVAEAVLVIVLERDSNTTGRLAHLIVR